MLAFSKHCFNFYNVMKPGLSWGEYDVDANKPRVGIFEVVGFFHSSEESSWRSLECQPTKYLVAGSQTDSNESTSWVESERATFSATRLAKISPLGKKPDAQIKTQRAILNLDVENRFEQNCDKNEKVGCLDIFRQILWA